MRTVKCDNCGEECKELYSVLTVHAEGTSITTSPGMKTKDFALEYHLCKICDKEKLDFIGKK